MAKRNIRKKQANRLRHALRHTPPQFYDLVTWLVTRGHAPTKRAARALILDGRVRHESHKVGFEEVEALNGEKVKLLRPHIPVKLLRGLTVVEAK